MEVVRRGAQECFPKDLVVGELLARSIRHSMARKQQLQDALDQALTDPLTSLWNRRAFTAELDRRLADWKRYRARFAVALFDIDHFKLVNDNYGHEVGDKVLRGVAAVLTGTTRETDLVVRYGGEEFGILFPVTDLELAATIVLRINQMIAASVCDVRGQLLSVTTSAGVAEVNDQDETATSILRRADRALYAAKRAGRDCCRLHDGMRVASWEESQSRHNPVMEGD